MISWLKCSKFLASAIVLSNRISDALGYISLLGFSDVLWEKASLDQLGVTSDKINSFELPKDHPGRILCKTRRACEKYISNVDADAAKAVFYLEQIWQEIMIRRKYTSPDPFDPSKTVGHSTAPLHSRRLNAPFTQEELVAYDNYSAVPLALLVTKDPKTNRLIWNRKYSRQLTLTSTCLGFYWVEEVFYSADMKKWKSLEHPLWMICKGLYDAMVAKDVEPGFTVPEKDGIAGQLSIIFRGAPKVRAVCRLISELVILGGRKLVLWSSLPANQILMHAIHKALRIPTASYSSELSNKDRSVMAEGFNEQQVEGMERNILCW